MSWLPAVAPLLAALLLSPLDPAEGESDRDNDKADLARVHTRRGEVVIGTLAIDQVAIETDYGVLRVPLAEIRSIAFARVLTAEEREELERGDEIETRPALDTLIATRFTIAGRLRLDDLDLKCAYGELRLSRSDIERVVIGDGPGRGVSDSAVLLKTWTDASGEFQNVHEILRSRTKLRLRELEAQSAADLTRQLRKHGVLVLPEFESGNDALTGLAAQAAGALRRWVMDGGVVVSCGGGWNAQFLTASRLLPCAGSSNSSQATVVRKHPIVRGVGGTIPAANATFPIHAQGAKRLKALATSQDGGVLVGVAEIGSGAVIYCGWDYYASDEPHQRVLANAVLWAAGRLGE